jgi:sugar lactone lactonase YvrE
MTPPRAILKLDEVSIAGTGFDGAESVVVDDVGVVYGGGKDGVIRGLAPDGRVTDFANTGGRPLGMAFDRDHNMIVCDIGLEKVVAIRPSGAIQPFAERAGGMRLGFPNGVVFDADGNLYVSNSFDQSLSDLAASAGSHPLSDHDRLIRLPHEKMAAEVRDQTPSGALIRIEPNGRSEIVARRLFCPNGIAIDPEETAVYVLQSTVANCLRVPLNGAPPEVYAEFESAPDGVTFDCDGNLIVTLPLLNRIVVLDRGGTERTLIDDPDRTKLDLPTNCAFGGPNSDELFIGHVIADHVARVRYGRTGHRLFHQRAT